MNLRWLDASHKTLNCLNCLRLQRILVENFVTTPKLAPEARDSKREKHLNLLPGVAKELPHRSQEQEGAAPVCALALIPGSEASRKVGAF